MRGRVVAAVAVAWLALMTSSSSVAAGEERRKESPAKRLYDDKLMPNSGYKKLIRPVDNTSESLTVRIGLRLTSIIDVVSVISRSSRRQQKQVVIVYLLAPIKIHKINSNGNNYKIVLNGQKGSMSTYRCPQSIHALVAKI